MTKPAITTEIRKARGREDIFMLHVLRASVVSLCLLLLMAPANAAACAVCFGDPDSPWGKALNWGILVLLAVVLTVLGGIVAFFVHMAKRARLPQVTTPQEELQP